MAAATLSLPALDLDAERARARLADLRARVDEALLELVPAGRRPEPLYAPARYVLEGGGKRLRPVLVLLTAAAYGVSTEDALPPALAVEVFHNFTLVHDDVMDHADTRRGRPTVHVRWDEDAALLSGDYLLALAYQQLAQTPRLDLPRAVGRFHEMVERLCEGQTLDKLFETRGDVDADDYLDMIARKTGALLQLALELGGLLGGASDDDLAALREAGARAGRAFQIQDDLLDLVADDERWGKAVGGDLREGKKTLLLLRSLARAREAGDEQALTLFRRAYDGGLPSTDIPAARSAMDRLGVLDEMAEAVRRRTADADELLGRTLPDTEAARTLRWLLRRFASRVH